MNPAMMIRGAWSYRSAVADHNAGRCPHDDTGTGRASDSRVVSMLEGNSWAGYLWRFNSDR